MKIPRGKRRFLLRTLWPSIKHFLAGEGFIVAGYVAFTSLFALFPFLIFLLALAGYVGQSEAASESIDLAFAIMPPEVTYALRPAVEDVRNGATPGLMTFSILFAVWFASSGMESLRHVLERAYGVEQSRSFVMNRMQSIGLTILTALGIIIIITAIVAGPVVRYGVEWLAQRQLLDRDLYLVSRYLIGLSLLMALTVFLHRVLPNLHIRTRHVLPGAILSVVVWAIVATLYSAYLRNFASYSVTYGSLAGIVLTLFFFYLSAVIFIFGAQFNGAIMRSKRHDKDEDADELPERPLRL